jgi:hypothetical protein
LRYQPTASRQPAAVTKRGKEDEAKKMLSHRLADERDRDRRRTSDRNRRAAQFRPPRTSPRHLMAAPTLRWAAIRLRKLFS